MDAKTILSALAILVSIGTFGLSFWFNWRSSVAAKRPVLVFVYDESAGWLLRNIGGGPALNVIVAQKRPLGSGSILSACRRSPKTRNSF